MKAAVISTNGTSKDLMCITDTIVTLSVFAIFSLQFATIARPVGPNVFTVRKPFYLDRNQEI